MAQKPSLPRGVRDFGPQAMAQRSHIIHTIQRIYHRYGFAQIETPALENLSVLMGKYGDEGDQLLFKILNSGDYLNGVEPEQIAEGSKSLTRHIAEKGLRYDLTVPFARFVVMHRNELTFPFKRYQIQPVWRADRPQKGRYREFYQCDADVVGTTSLLCEAEILAMIQEVMTSLGLAQYACHLNSRKVLAGLAEVAGVPGQEANLCVAIDKLDKIGLEAVKEELVGRGFGHDTLQAIDPIFHLAGSNAERLQHLQHLLASSTVGTQGVAELTELLQLAQHLGVQPQHVVVDPVLARGLGYYTGPILELKALGIDIGSIGGGGRYDNLTGSFGLDNMPGVGFSFGIDRLFDVLSQLDLFPSQASASTQVLLAHPGAAALPHTLQLLAQLRQAHLLAEIYPDEAKMKKQLQYAASRGIGFFLILGTEELAQNKVALKNLNTGEQNLVSFKELTEIIQPK